MRLYHFTSEASAALIQVEGIKPTYIQVPRKGQSRHPVVSLTADPDPTPLIKKSLWDGTELSGDALGGYLEANLGAVPPIVGTNTVARRIHLEVPEQDGNLYMLEYPDIAALGFTDQAHIDEFVMIGGGIGADWRIYLGQVPVGYIVNIDDPR
jgi:hypothetical protein